MKTLKFLLLALCAACFSPVNAAENTPADAIAIVDKGLAFLKKNGPDALIKSVNGKNPDFINGDIYLAMRSMDGTSIAHPMNPKVIGKNMVDLPDADGKYYRREMLEIAKTKGKGWVEYRYNNPSSNVIEKKATYFVRAGDVILEAGIYKGK